ncbi:hypothetical protein SAMN04488087_1997 [Rhodothermus profundi]|uniref:DUF4382 domain-containing protein n=2 Tax=Rhodothermus profundi TaxID=633813 RepID=A0A1M6VDG4_9BACT|nr:hypothetical protein SAMN04488087_1997 [Rhodothermus profundi]
MGRCGHLIVLLSMLLAGCGGSRELIMAPPRPAALALPDTTVFPARLTLTLSANTPLPLPFQTLTVTIHLIALQRADGYRQPLVFARRTVTFTRTAAQQWTLLEAAPIPPGRYDTLWVHLSEVAVRFGPNAGGSLTAPTDTLAFPVTLELRPALSYAYHLRFDWQHSLQAKPECRWRFTPRLSLEMH